MRLLLDTHIWIWALHSPEKLGRRLRRELGRAGNELYLSPVSIWEAHHLIRRKRLRVRQGFAPWLDEVMAQVPLREAPFTFAVAADAARIDLPQSDLGDIFLAATALVFDLTLATSDSQLLACSWLKTLPND
jgi:PIN domain nuclease of toxin-antitoxin system